MNTIIGARVAKFVALFGFFLPWALFSCSGQEFASMSGVDIAIGHIHANGQDQSIGLNIFVLIAIIATGLGLLASFGGDLKDEARGVVIGAVVAIIACFAGMMWLKGTPEREAHNTSARSSYNAQMNASVLAMIQIKEQYGYFLTLMGLAGAAVFGGIALSGQELPALPEGLVDSMAPARRRPEDDIADWDRLADKDNPDQLQEYLLRHPEGRFSELARMKLERMGIEPLRQPPPPPRAPPPPQPPPPVMAPYAPAAAAVEPVASSYAYAEDVEQPRSSPPVALFVAIGVVMLAALAAGGFFLKQNIDAQRAAAVAQQAAAAEQAQRDLLATRVQTCQSHGPGANLTLVVQDCADLVWSADSAISQAASAQITRAANERAPMQAVPLPQVPDIFIDNDFCPGEGCQYGVWQTRQATPVYASPNGARSGSLTAGERVIALRGQVYTTPVHGVVRQPIDQMSPGDDVYLLTYLGEGSYRLWHAGAVLGTPYSAESCDPKQGPCQSPFDFGTFQQDLHWWVLVRRQDGTSGWVVDRQNFTGTDAFE